MSQLLNEKKEYPTRKHKDFHKGESPDEKTDYIPQFKAYYILKKHDSRQQEARQKPRSTTPDNRKHAIIQEARHSTAQSIP